MTYQLTVRGLTIAEATKRALVFTIDQRHERSYPVLSPKLHKMSGGKRRKIDDENRQFNPKWTDDYFFILPSHAKAKPFCLICQTSPVSVCKVDNVRRHFDGKHAAKYNADYPTGSTARRSQIEKLKKSYDSSTTIITTAATAQEKATAASLRVMFALGKKGKPFLDAEMVKEGAIEMVAELFAGEKMQEEIINRMKQVPLSDTTGCRRVEVLFEDCISVLLDELKSTDYMSLAMDESTDATDTAQLSLFVRYFNGDIFKEELLGLIPLTENTTGEVMFTAVKSFFEKHGLDLGKINLLVTDGCPSMIGRERGVASRLRAEHPTVHTLHCIIHQSVLCAKLSGELKEAMETVVKIVNHIRSTSSLQHRLFKMLLQEKDAPYSDLLQHNDVRWLSRGNVLERFFALKGEVEEFLSSQKSNKAKDLLAHMKTPDFIAQVAFLCDIMGHLNKLNLDLQGKGSSVAEILEHVNAFQVSLALFLPDITAKKLHFPTLRKVPVSRAALAVMKLLLQSLAKNFTERFGDFNIHKELLLFVRDPFAVDVSGSCAAEANTALPTVDEAAFQLELVKIQSSDVLKAKLKKDKLGEFWAHATHQFPHCRRLAIYLLTMFGSTYVCESGFSTMNLIKNQQRNRLTDDHLNHCMQLALTSHQPAFNKLAMSRKCNFSH